MKAHVTACSIVLTLIGGTASLAAAPLENEPPDSSAAAVSATLEQRANTCERGPETLCLRGSRFKVEVDWKDFQGQAGKGKTVLFGSDDSGMFYFFSPDNWEMLVKVLRACGSSNPRYWVFAAATTNVEYTLKVTDTQSGQTKQYKNPLGTSSDAITDTNAFATCP